MRFLLFASLVGCVAALDCKVTSQMQGLQYYGVLYSNTNAVTSEHNCEGKCIALKMVQSTSMCDRNTVIALGCAKTAGTQTPESDVLLDGAYSTKMCGKTAFVSGVGGKHAGYNVKYICSDTNSLALTKANNLIVSQPGQEDWRCNDCSAAEPRDKKSALTAFLLQFFLAYVSAGLWYYELNGLAAGLLCATLVPCCCCCILGICFMRDGGQGGFSGLGGGSGSGSPCPEEEEEAMELSSSEGSGAGTGSGAGSGAGSGGDEAGSMGLAAMAACCCCLIATAGNIANFVFMILIALNDTVPDTEKFCVKPM